MLCRSLAQAEECQRHVLAAKYQDIQFIYPHTLAHQEMDYVSLLKDCKDVISDDYVDIVVCFHPGLELVKAELVGQFEELKGPSFESAFLCVHRIYNKKYVTTGFNTAYGVITPEDVNQQEVVSILEETGTPVVVRDSFRTDMAMKCKKARSVRGVLKDKEEFHEKLCKTYDLLGGIINGKLVGLPRYEDLSDEKMCILEEYWDPAREPMSIHIVEGCVAEEEFVPWAISDVMYWKHKPRCVKGVVSPTKLGESAQYDIWAIMREVVQRLIVCGFNDQFVHAKIMLLPDGNVRVIDMNASLYVDNIAMHRHVYQHGDSLRALCDIGLGRMPSHPKLRPLRYAVMACIVSFAQGFAYEMLKFKVIKTLPDVTVLIDETTSLEPRSDDGAHLANVYAMATTYDECVEKIQATIKEIIKDEKDIKCPWIDS